MTNHKHNRVWIAFKIKESSRKKNKKNKEK